MLQYILYRCTMVATPDYTVVDTRHETGEDATVKDPFPLTTHAS